MNTSNSSARGVINAKGNFKKVLEIEIPEWETLNEIKISVKRKKLSENIPNTTLCSNTA